MLLFTFWISKGRRDQPPKHQNRKTPKPQNIKTPKYRNWSRRTRKYGSSHLKYGSSHSSQIPFVFQIERNITSRSHSPCYNTFIIRFLGYIVLMCVCFLIHDNPDPFNCVAGDVWSEENNRGVTLFKKQTFHCNRMLPLIGKKCNTRPAAIGCHALMSRYPGWRVSNSVAPQQMVS